MLIAIFSAFVVAVFVQPLFKFSKKRAGAILSLLPLMLFLYFAYNTSAVLSGQLQFETYEWIPSLGIHIAFVMDGIGLLFSLIITGIGTVIFLYAGSYMQDYKYMNRFYIYIIIFMASMLGVVLSDNFLVLFVFWELTSISSYLLIGFNHHKEESRYSALQALLITGTGGLALLAGLILLSIASGTFSVSELLASGIDLSDSELYVPIVILIFLGAFTKSAQFPFHFWLPNAMTAPTPVSAYLHSATMVKAGIFLLARFNPVLGGTELWQDTLLIVGTVTMVIGGALSIKQSDLKKLLAYTTVSVLGTLTMLIGIGTELAIKAFTIYLIAHALYKATLFLVSGTIDHETGTRNVDKLSGLRTFMPITAITAILASLSKMGIIPLVGFVGKETVYASILELSDFGTIIIFLAILANAFIVVVTLLVGFKPFLGKFKDLQRKIHEAPFAMWAGPLILAVLGLLFGLIPQYIFASLIDQTALSIISKTIALKVKLWHGFNTIFFLSVLTVAMGILLFYFRIKIFSILISIKFVPYFKPSFWYDYILKGVMTTARAQTLLLQNGYLRYYIIFILLTFLTLSGYVLFVHESFDTISLDLHITFYEIALSILIIVAVGITIHSKSRLTAVTAIGIVGFSIGIVFIIYGAPDLALTQFAIEILTVILFVLVIYKLPRYLRFSSLSGRIRDLIIASAVGVTMFFVVLLITSAEMSSELKQFFADVSMPDGKGRNIVNVILVDFRAFDTMGELVVLAIAALGVYALLKLKLGNGK
ncbi:MAG: putative monovalent cation/H+ antiporter subunit A [Melioribacteraceae bacterium]|nr:putative monovalent cation/H+ antiporter subunit A [Melioribacteraceae bacterium]